MDKYKYNHTPGEWYEYRSGFSTVYIESRLSGGVIQEVAACGPTEAGSDQQHANARLITAAPELLEALQLAKHVIENMLPVNSHSRNKVSEMAGKAIKKALGE